MRKMHHVARGGGVVLAAACFHSRVWPNVFPKLVVLSGAAFTGASLVRCGESMPLGGCHGEGRRRE